MWAKFKYAGKIEGRVKLTTLVNDQGKFQGRGNLKGVQKSRKYGTCVDTFGYDWKWYDYENGAVLTSAGEGLKIVCVN